MSRGKGDLPLTRCDRPGDYARVHGTMQAYSRWGCRCQAAREQRSAWVRAWRETPNGRASIERTNRRKVRRRPPSTSAMLRAERENLVATLTRNGESARKIAAEIGRTDRSVQHIRAKLRAQGRLP